MGAGPNGLSAAIVLAQAGLRVDVFEAEAVAGGAARTLELTIPGFRHDFGSAVHPLAVGSPFFNSLPLAAHGLEWIHSPSVLAHPLDDGTAVLLDRDFANMKETLGRDAKCVAPADGAVRAKLADACAGSPRADTSAHAPSVFAGAIRAGGFAAGEHRCEFLSSETNARKLYSQAWPRIPS